MTPLLSSHNTAHYSRVCGDAGVNKTADFEERENFPDEFSVD